MGNHSVQFSHLVVANSLRPHESQHTRPPCPPPTPGLHSDSCPSSHWCHPAISSSVTVKGFGIVKKAEIDVFLELFCFFHDPADVGNLISGSSAFSKTSLNIREFTVHVLLKPGLENFEHFFTSMWDECNCVVVWAFFCIAFLTQYVIIRLTELYY